MKINNLFKNFVLSKSLNLNNDKLKSLSYQIENIHKMYQILFIA